MLFMNLQYGAQDLEKINTKSLIKSLKKDVITNGDYCRQFEKKFAKSRRVNLLWYNNGTSALYLAILSLLRNEKIVAIIPNINFVAAMSILCHLNAKIILCDVNSKGMIDENFNECLKK